MAKDCWVGPFSGQCMKRRVCVRCHPPIPGMYGLYVHNNCACNEYVALRGRVLGEVPLPTQEGVGRVWEELRRLRWQCKATKEMDGQRFVSKYHGPKRTK